MTDTRLKEYRRPAALQGATGALGAWAHQFACVTDGSLSARRANLSRLAVPLDLIWGSLDTVTPPAQAQRIRDLVPGSVLHVIDGVGHIPHIEDPAAFEATLTEVLATAPASRSRSPER